MRIGEHITADQVRALRDESGEGMMACIEKLQREEALAIVDADLELRPAMRAVIRWLVERA